MKRLLALVLVFVTFCFYGCNKSVDFPDYVSDLRYDICCGSGERFTLKAYVGERENPYVNDGICNPRVGTYVKFILTGGTDNAEHTLAFNFEGTAYSYKMTPDAVSFLPTAEITVTGFECKNLAVTVSEGAYFERFTLNSVVDPAAMDYKTAVKKLTEQVPYIIENNTTESGFNAELYVRVVVEKQRTYWYIGIADGNKIRAVLIDGITGELLAAKDVY